MPIRTAIIGLSSSGTGWAGSAHLPYLLSSRGRERYTIVAICNSTKEAAERAIERYQLAPETKAYGDPRDLAGDKNVDLVVCCTRVDKHLDTILPSVKAGKDIYLEWPLAHNFQHSQGLVDAAREHGNKTIVGLQGRFAPVLEQVQSLIANGRIGKVLSAEIRATGASDHPEILPDHLKYFTDWKIGGNIFTIYFGHLFDQIQHVIGDITDIHGHFQVQRPDIRIIDSSTKKLVETVKSDVPDLIILRGQLQAPCVADGATLLARFLLGAPFPGQPAMVWHITGEQGEIRLTAEGTTTLQAQGYDKPVAIQVRNFDTNEVEAVEWKWSDWQTELPIPARSVGRFYEAFASGGLERVPNLEDSLRRHKQLEDMLNSSKR